MKSILTLGLLALVLASSCDSSTKRAEERAEAAALKQLTNDSTAVKQTFYFGFTDELDTDSSKIYVAKSLFNTDTVGLQIEVMKDIQPGINAEGRPVEAGFVEGDIRLSTIGTPSNNLVVALGSLFSLPTDSKMTDQVLTPTVFSSNSKVVDLNSQGTYSFKLFLNNNLGQPAEVFAVLDLYRRAFEVSEKDSVYRAEIIAAFEGK